MEPPVQNVIQLASHAMAQQPKTAIVANLVPSGVLMVARSVLLDVIHVHLLPLVVNAKVASFSMILSRSVLGAVLLLIYYRGLQKNFASRPVVTINMF